MHKTAMLIFATEESRRLDVSVIENIERVDSRQILQGVENGRGWTIVIPKKTRRLSATVSDEEMGFVVFGDCTKD